MKMRITHISDTHNKHNQLNGLLPGGDLLIHSGDISSIGRESEVERFIKWFNGIDNYTNKVFIAGNHDLSFESEILFRNKSEYFDGVKYDGLASAGKPQWLDILLASGLNDNVYYLENSDVTIDGIKIWGSPVTPSFGYGWAFNEDRGTNIAKVWEGIPTDSDIVVTHGPIYGYCDTTYRTYENVGCNDLFQRLSTVRPQLHFSGHIHEAYGYKSIQFGDWSGYAFNGCSCNLRYEVENKVITFDYDFETKEIIDFINDEPE
jgi:Icc-related predicted phosphoesterase